MTKENLARLLTYAGLIPFVSLALIQGIQPDFLALNYATMMMAYGAIIVSFISGMHWGVYVFKTCPINLFIHSNILALLAWLSLLCPPVWGMFILIFCFVYLLIIDWTLHKAEVLPTWFWLLRVRVTSIVVLTLGSGVLILF